MEIKELIVVGAGYNNQFHLMGVFTTTEKLIAYFKELNPTDALSDPECFKWSDPMLPKDPHDFSSPGDEYPTMTVATPEEEPEFYDKLPVIFYGTSGIWAYKIPAEELNKLILPYDED